MIKILITVICLILIVYVISKRSRYFLITPQFAFVVSFIPSLVLLSLFVEKWSIDLDYKTMLLIIVGAGVFTGVSFLSESFLRKYRIKGVFADYHISNIKTEERLVENSTIVLFIIAGSIGVAAYLVYVASFSKSFSISDISTVLRNYRDAYNENDLDMPAFVSVTSMVATCISYYCVFYFFKHRKSLSGHGIKILLLFISCIPGVIIPFLSGARGGLINYGIYVFSAVLINSTKEKKIQRKTITIAIILAIVAVATLRLVGILMGREINDSTIDYIGMYLPAPIRNLDYIIRTENIGLFSGFGDSANRTFSKLLKFLSFRFGLQIAEAPVRRTLMVNGYFTGNMYTGYYNLLHDAGYIGALLLLALTAFLCQLFYAGVRRQIVEGETCSNTRAIAYTMVYSCMFLSFFNENFFFNVFTNYFLRQIVFFYLIDWFVRKTNVPPD